jgi:membrane protein DedA with SNARE-associated domain
MEIFSNHEVIIQWLTHYGSVILFILLVLGIIALPVPEETLMVLAGVLMKQGSLNIPLTILAAYMGSICGISLSYAIGRTTGHYFIQKYGSWVGIGENHIQRAHRWFEHFGKWTLSIGYFIPGVRHFTGIASGMTQLEFKQFALYAYSGAAVWVSIFLSLGYFFSDYWFSAFENLEIGIENVITAIALILIFYFLYSKIKNHFFKVL